MNNELVLFGADKDGDEYTPVIIFNVPGEKLPWKFTADFATTEAGSRIAAEVLEKIMEEVKEEHSASQEHVNELNELSKAPKSEYDN